MYSIRYTFLRSTPPILPGQGVAARELSVPQHACGCSLPWNHPHNSRANYCHWALGDIAPDPAGDMEGCVNLCHRPAVATIQAQRGFCRNVIHASQNGENIEKWRQGKTEA